MTERVRVEDAGDGLPLEEYRTLVEQSPVMVWRSRADGRRDFFNGAWLSFTGRTAEQERGDGWTQGVHPDDLERCVQTLRVRFQRREGFQIEYRLRRHDGAYRSVFDRGTPFYESGQFQGFVGSCADIQERHEAEEAQKSFIRMMGHELRTPLQSLSMFVEILRRQAGRGETSPPESFSKAKLQLDRLSRLVTDLLEATRLTELPLSLEPLDLEDLVEGVVETRRESLRATAPDVKHSVAFQAENGPFPIVGDRLRLEQVFDKLIENGIKYSPRGGSIEVAMRSKSGWHSVSVSDPGIGIPAEDLKSVGQRFFRAQNASANNFPGLGVGLALSREIVERLQGALGIESRAGQGTRVTVTLPARETERL